jgi:hypothetical protein
MNWIEKHAANELNKIRAIEDSLQAVPLLCASVTDSPAALNHSVLASNNLITFFVPRQFDSRTEKENPCQYIRCLTVATISAW